MISLCRAPHQCSTIVTMCAFLVASCSEGEKRILRIPPHMGYGDRGAGADIPGQQQPQTGTPTQHSQQHATQRCINAAQHAGQGGTPPANHTAWPATPRHMHTVQCYIYVELHRNKPLNLFTHHNAHCGVTASSYKSSGSWMQESVAAQRIMLRACAAWADCL